jgi:hypothetical protein
MMFQGAQPNRRREVMEYFFRRSKQKRIERFFSGRLSIRDRIGILATLRPPISPWKAVPLIPERIF